MDPITPIRNRFQVPSLNDASSPFSTHMIPSSAHPSSRSTTPDSVYSDVTHPTETPRRIGNGWTPIRRNDGILNGNGHRNDGEVLGDTPRVRIKKRKDRIKPSYQPGITAYPLTFQTHDDIYTFSSDPNQITHLLDREHIRVSALPSAIFQPINESSYHLDEAQIRRINYFTMKTKQIISANVRDPTFRPFPLEDPDSSARSLKQYTDKYAQKLEREERRSRGRGRPKVPEPIRKFSAEDWETWERLVALKGRLPLHMGEYDAWVTEWQTGEIRRREGRTSFGRVVAAAGGAAGGAGAEARKGGKGKRKRDDLTVSVPERPGSVAALQVEQEDHGSPVASQPMKKQRTETPIEEPHDSEPLISRAPPSKKARTAPPTTAPITTSAQDPEPQPHARLPTKVPKTERIAAMRARAAYSSSVTPTTSAESVQVVQVVDASKRSRHYTTTPTSAESVAFVQVVEASRSVIGVGKQKSKSSKRGDRADGGRGLGFTVSKSSITSSCSSPDPFEGKVESRVAGLEGFGAGTAGDGVMVRIPTPTQTETFVTARSTAGPVAIEALQAEQAPIVPEPAVNGAESTAFTAEYWTEMRRKKAELVARRRSGVKVVSDEESSAGVPSAGILGADDGMEAVQADVGYDAVQTEEMEGIEDAEKFPSLSFPKDLPTSTPKIDRTAQPNADETTIMHSSPGRPVWQCESLPQDPPVRPRNEEPMQATQSSEPDLPVVPNGAGSMSDLAGLMDDLTSSRRRARSTANAKRSGWNVTSSPADEPGSLGMGDSQQIRRMGQGVMEMTAELLGQELIE